MTDRELARENLDNRWLLIVAAKTIKEMRRIEGGTRCTFCRHYKTLGYFMDCEKACPLAVNNKCCDGHYVEFVRATHNEDLPKARCEAIAIVSMLAAIANTPEEPVKVWAVRNDLKSTLISIHFRKGNKADEVFALEPFARYLCDKLGIAFPEKDSK